MNKSPKYVGRHLNVHEINRKIHGRDVPLEYVERPKIVICIATNDTNEIAFVRQHRIAASSRTIELPAGKIEANEEPSVAAVRELREETGLRCEDARLLNKFFVAPHFSDEFAYLFEANIVGDGLKMPTVEEEICETRLLAFDQIRAAIDNGEFTDPKSITSLVLYQRASGKRILNE